MNNPFFNRLTSQLSGVGEKVIAELAADEVRGYLERNAEGFAVGFFGTLSQRFRVAFESALTAYINDELVAKQDVNPALARKFELEVLEFLRNIEPWASSHFMLRVVLSKEATDRNNLLDSMFRAVDNTERQHVIDRVVGQKPLMTELGEFIEREFPRVWQGIKDFSGDATQFMRTHAPVFYQDARRWYDELMHGQTLLGGTPDPNHPGLIALSGQLADWSDNMVDDLEARARKGQFLVLGNTFAGRRP